MVTWFFPVLEVDESVPTNEQIAAALLALLETTGKDEVEAVLEQWSAIFSMNYTFTVFYLTMLHANYEDNLEVIQELQMWWEFLHYLQEYGVVQICAYLHELREEIDFSELFPIVTEIWIKPLEHIRSQLSANRYPLLFALVCQELGDLQAMMFDETQDESYLQQAHTTYSQALATFIGQEKTIDQAYLYMQRASITLLQAGDKQKDLVEEAITDLETALGLENDSVLQGRIYQLRGQAYCQRGYGRRKKNLRQAIEAYDAALLHFTCEIAPQSRVETLYLLIQIYSELREEQSLKDTFAVWRATAQYQEQLAREQFQNGEVWLPLPATEPLESEAVTAALEEWLKLYDPIAQYTFLLEYQSLLASDEALAILRHLCTAAEMTDVDGRTEYLTRQLSILENTRNSSVDVAWQLYVRETLPMLEMVQLFMIAPSFQSIGLQMVEEKDILISPVMLAVMYAFSQLCANEDEAEQALQTIKILKRIRSGELPFTSSDVMSEMPTVVSSREVDDEDDEPFITPYRLLMADRNDPLQRAIGEELSRLSPETLMLLLPYFSLGALDKVLDPADFTKLGSDMREILDLLDPQQTPYLRALCLLGSLQARDIDLQQALLDCETVLDLLDEATFPNSWAMAMSARISIHSQIFFKYKDYKLSFDERQLHVQQCMNDIHAVETYYSLEEKPYEWATIRVMYGIMAYESYQITRDQYNFEQILADFTHALPIIAKYGNLGEHISLYVYRARIVFEDTKGDLREKFEHVIEDCNHAIILSQAHISSSIADFWAHALLIRALAYMGRVNGGQRDNIEQAINDFNMALSVYTKTTDLRDWSAAITGRGSAYMQRVAGDRVDNLEKALQDFTEALLELKDYNDAMLVGKILLNRSDCYLQRMTHGRVRNQHLALDDCNQAFSLFDNAGFLIEKATALNSRAAIYMQLLSGDKYENFIQARNDCDIAIELFSQAAMPLERAKTLVSRGMIYNSLSALISRKERSIGMRTRMQRLFNSHSESVPELIDQTNVLVQHALDDFTRALEVLTREQTPGNWARALCARAITYAFQPEGYMTGQRVDIIRRGIFDYNNALTVLSPQETPLDWATTMANRGVLYAEIASPERIDDAMQALDDMEKAQTVFTPRVSPANFCRFQYTRAKVYIVLKKWSLAHSILTQMREVQRDLMASAPVSQDQTLIVAEFAMLDIYELDAWIMLQIEPIDDVAIALVMEEGRARSQRLALDLDDIHPERIPSGDARERMKAFLKARNHLRQLQYQTLYQTPAGEASPNIHVAYNAFMCARESIQVLDDPDFMTPAPTQQSIENSFNAPGEALVYLVASSMLTLARGMALIVMRDYQGKTHFKHLLLPALHDHALLDLLEVKDDTTHVMIAEAMNELGPAGLNEVVHFLVQRRVLKVRLVPYGWLGLFPLPSVLVSVDDNLPRPMSDFFEEITIVPSARSQEIAYECIHSAVPQRHTLLMAGNPKPLPADMASLPYAEPEAESVKQIAQKYGYPNTHVLHLLPREIKRARVIEELQKARYAHLALHGQYCVGDPRSSRLVLAGSAQLEERERSIYLGEVLDGAINLRGLRLLILSACETSIVDMQRVPNEALGIAAGFLHAGASAVIASLWPVDDKATYLLMVHFAHLYLDPQNLYSPGRALAAAQYWLRSEATNTVLAKFDSLTFNLPSALRLSYEQVQSNIQSIARVHIAEGQPDALPYAKPFFWAGFVVVGV